MKVSDARYELSVGDTLWVKAKVTDIDINSLVDNRPVEVEFHLGQRWLFNDDEISLTEPQAEKVEVPSCMGEFLDNYRDKDETAMSHIMIEFTESENFSDFLEFPLSDYPMGWDRLMASALLYGYTVKQTLWVIKDLDDEYISDVCLHQPDKVYNSSNRERSEILIFTDRAKAEAVATLVDGSVEEV